MSIPATFNEAIDSVLAELALPEPVSLCVAYSGGLDSTVLLALASTYSAQQPGVSLRALHVNHRLSELSDDWQAHCQAACEHLGVPFEAFGVDVSRTAELGLEAAAREVRYAVIEQSLQPNEILLLAQHQDDQLETVMLQLMRGSGVKGLAAMPALAPFGAGYLCRPLLEVERDELHAFGLQWRQEKETGWIEDPSNFDTALDRNFLRHTVLPMLKDRWPSAARTAARSARLCAEADALNRELAESDAAGIRQDNALQITELQRLEPARQRNLIRWLLDEQGLPMPPAARLAEVTGSLMHAAADAVPEVHWPGAVVYRYRDALYVFSEQALIPPEQPNGVLEPGGSVSLGSAGILSLEPADEGLRIPEGGFNVKFRSGGERIRPAGSANSKSLKNLFQELGVPLWMRERIPLFYCGAELVAVGDLIIADGWLVEAKDAAVPACSINWTGHLPVTYPA